MHFRNSFRIQRLDSFHAISHGIPVRSGSGPARRPNRSGTARVGGVAGVFLSISSLLVPTDPHVLDAVGSQVNTVRHGTTQNTDFGFYNLEVPVV